jgi:putative cardiolipin synthase
MLSSLKWQAILASTLWLVACTSIEPQRDRPIETALTPASAESWPGLANSQGHDRLVPLNLGSQALLWRLRSLRSATTSIDLQTFIWKNDSVGLAFVREIVAAAERGVRVRVLLDDSFLTHADISLKALASHTNISYRIYNPAARRSDNLVMRQLENLNDFSRINHRMHNKLLVVDGRLAIIGGRNQADEYFGYEPNHNFRDFELVLSGPFLPQLSDVFDLYWNDPWSLPIEDLDKEVQRQDFSSVQTWLQENTLEHHQIDDPTTQDWSDLFARAYTADLKLVVDSPPDASPALDEPTQLAEDLLKRIDDVQHDLILVSAYFIPTETLTRAIERATSRGVKVRILTNSLGSNNHVSAHASYAAHRPALLRAGVELYELRADAVSRGYYLDTSFVQTLFGLHEKGAIFDDCCLFVGSANLDPRSLRLNTEVGLLIESPGLNSRVRELLALDFLPENAWRVELDRHGNIEWTGSHGKQSHTPPASFYMRAESWFFGLLPIEGQM